MDHMGGKDFYGLCMFLILFLTQSGWDPIYQQHHNLQLKFPFRTDHRLERSRYHNPQMLIANYPDFEIQARW